MGMSASQARLLTITGRLTDNEMRSQTITNAKLRLAQKSSEASQIYMDALSSEKLVFKSYDTNGVSSSCNLTPALLYSYEPLKNQYSIQNASGQNLVSATDAKNFKETNDLVEFLKRYGLVDQENLNGSYEDDMNAYDKYLSDYEKWSEKNKTYTDYKVRLYEFEQKHDAWQAEQDQYVADNKKYLEDLENFDKIPNLYKDFTEIVGTSTSPKSCYAHALNNSSVCYVHVLAHLLDYSGGSTVSSKEYTASNGKNVKFGSSDVSGSQIYSDEKSGKFKALSDEIAKNNKYCDGDDNSNTPNVKENIIQSALDEGREPTELEILKSDYVYDAENKKVKTNANGEPELKTLRQKTIDLLYILKNNLITDNAEMKETLINFTDGDMQKLDARPTPPTPPGEEPVFTETEPENPGEPPAEVKKPFLSDFDFTLTDKDKAQWYINLWYMMNGSESANKVKSSTNEAGQTIYGVACNKVDNIKSANSKNYKVIEDELFTSSDWLTFALKNGIVTLSQASYFNPSTDSGKVATMTAEGYYWSATAYSSTSDIVAVEDEVAIAKAEVKYKNTTTELENQDKKYDQDLKKLDTEHNALQTEYESMKNVIDKNVERSFKAFS